jgi:peptidoglycan/LPS O-acetylase OafA/YrhL
VLGTWSRRAHLDGLRAIAVYLVVLFHTGAVGFDGGYLGVDVFFVLSGYLVTQLLRRDLDGPGGIGFARFYSRRFRRLLPASFLTLVLTAAAYTAVANPIQVAESRRAFQAAFLYVANWFFIDQSTDYFGADVGRSPVLQFWSLAIEEQFYLVWPIALGAMSWATRRLPAARVLAPRLLIGLGALASAGWALSLRATEPDRAYFGTDTRAYQLLVGAFLAFTPALFEAAARHGRATRWLSAIGVGSLVALSLGDLVADPVVRGMVATGLAAVVIVGLDSGVPGPATRLLAWRPVDYLGRISYGTYLWHWPVIIITLEVADVGPLPLTIGTLVVATTFAAVSARLVEQPIRNTPRLDRHRHLVIATGLSVSVLAAVAVIPLVLSIDPSPTDDTASAGEDGVPTQDELGEIFYEGFGETVDCVDRPADACTVVHGEGPHVLLMGDSNAQMYIPAFTEIAEREGLTLSLAVTAGCPWQRDLYRLSQEIRDRCRRAKTDAYERVIPELDPDLIVLANTHLPADPYAEAPTDSELDRQLQSTTEDSLRELATLGAQVLVLESAPYALADENPFACLMDGGDVESCSFQMPTAPSWVEVMERRLAGELDNVTTADLDGIICPELPTCRPMLDGEVVFWNERHLTARYSRSLADEISGRLAEEGLLLPS